MSELRVSQTTVEGAPVQTIYRVEPGRVLVLRDSTRDPFGKGDWDSVVCSELRVRTLETSGCLVSGTIDDRTPTRFIDRSPAANCGHERARTNTGTFDTLPQTCFFRALDRGEAAELRISRRSEEGPTTEYLRVIGPGRFEVFTDATRGGTGPPAWYYKTCRELDGGTLVLRGCALNERL